MILLTHIIIALSSVVLAVLGLVRPAEKTITATTYAAAGTVASGIVLALVQNVSITHLCASGIVVVGFCLTSVAIANRRLANSRQRS